jgi:zinc protease
MIAFGFQGWFMSRRGMRNLLLTIIITLSCGLSLGAQQYAPGLDFKSKTLLNNLNIYVTVTPHLGEQMTIGLAIRYGAAFDLEEKGGLANILSRMLTRDVNNKRSKELESLGATLEIHSDWDCFRFILKGQSAKVEQSLSLLSQIVAEAQFSEEDFTAVKQQVLQEIQRPLDQRRKIRAQFESILYKGVPAYGRPILGTVKTVKTCTVGDVRYFYHKFFIPDEAALVVVGNMDVSLVLQKVPRIWGSWVRNDPTLPTFVNPKQPAGQQVYLEDDPDSPAAQFLVGSLFPRRTPSMKDYRSYRTYFYALVVSHILQDRLNKQLPTSLLTVGHEGRQMEGPFYIQGQAGAEQAVEQIRKILDEIGNLKNSPVADVELLSAQKSLIEEFSSLFNNTEGICKVMLDAELYHLGENYSVKFRSWILECNADVVKQVANEWMLPGAIIVVRGPAAILKSALEPLDSSNATKP